LTRIINARIVRKGKTKLVTIETSPREIIAVRSQKGYLKNSSADYDAAGGLVLPGLIDCHAHMFELGYQELGVNLRSARSIAEMKKRIREKVSDPATLEMPWVIGSGWDQDLFAEKRYPDRTDVDDVVSDRPAIMTRICGHIAVLNSKAIQTLEFLGRFDEDLVPRLADGSLSGIVKESALEECWKRLPSIPIEQISAILEKVQEKVMKLGLVGAHCILSSDWKNELAAVRLLDEKGRLLLSLSLLLPISALAEIESMSRRERTRILRGKNYCILGIKLFADGSLGARTAALSSPYNDDPENSGVLLCTEKEIVEYARRAKSLELILATHAIGDRAVLEVANGYRKAGIWQKDGFRIEHCSVVERETVRMLRGFVLSVQPSFATSDYWIRERLGKKRRAYALKSLSKVSRLIGGSDAPVEDVDPLKGICAATSNPLASESLSFSKAVELYSSNASAASNWNRRVGKIAKRYEANLFFLNISDPRRICGAEPSRIYLRGKQVL
jgi:predicted amidohydrolase YtcJ